eukprot:TRINITY_DN16969_c0_g1_i1.p1 TRINITY_DN16969_c0_g1~~TRINITY_DN16969_c0_g1_i1.p1  ORF type:complete len:418 (-),score=67.25 TRINITY_DN16969_c0_g1_i1:3-1256(-)
MSETPLEVLHRLLALADGVPPLVSVPTPDNEIGVSRFMETKCEYLKEVSRKYGLWHLLSDHVLDTSVLEADGDGGGEVLASLSRLWYTHCSSLFNCDVIEATGISVPLSPPLSPLSMWLYHFPLALHLFISCQRELSTHPNKRCLVGIAGPPGAGKSVISTLLCSLLNRLWTADGVLSLLLPPSASSLSTAPAISSLDVNNNGPRDVCIVHGMDGYHLTNDVLDTLHLREWKGSPQTFDVKAFHDNLTRLISVQPSSSTSTTAAPSSPSTIRLPRYDRTLHDPVHDAVLVKPHHRVVILEGMFLLWNGESAESSELQSDPVIDQTHQAIYRSLSSLLDVRILLYADADQCRRSVVDRKVLCGRDRGDSEKHFERVDLPNWKRVCGHVQAGAKELDQAEGSTLVLRVSDTFGLSAMAK